MLERIKQNEVKACGDYRDAASEDRAILDQVIHEVPDHNYLKNYNLKMTFREKKKKKGGRIIYASIRRFSDHDYFLHGYHAEILISHPFWVGHPEKRKPLIDHELCHLWQGEEGLEVRGHDIEEFYEVIERHGDWNMEVERLKGKQLDFLVSL
jgi:hypothetical protein